MNLYAVEIQVVMTAYVKADSEDEARTIAERNLTNVTHELINDGFIMGDDYVSESLPRVSVSPAITILGPWKNDPNVVQLSAENVPPPADEVEEEE